jgi:hypothetical protein
MVIGQFAKLLHFCACGFEPHSFRLLQFHFLELKLRGKYYLLSFGLSSSIAFFYLPSLLNYSPYFFLNHKWEDALFAFISLALILAFISTFPLLLFHLFLFFIPALFYNEYLILSYNIFFISVFIYIY